MTKCSPDIPSVTTIPKQLGESLRFVCSPHCYSGSFVYEHYNHSTREYDVLQGQSLYQININFTAYVDGGLYRCWERCDDTDEEPPYCYLKVQVVPDTVKMNFRQAILNESDNGLCSARGHPPPMIHVQSDSNKCNYTTILADDINVLTTQMIITIPICQKQTSIRLNIIAHESSSNTTMTGRGKSTTHEASSLALVVTGIITAVGIWWFCM